MPSATSVSDVVRTNFWDLLATLRAATHRVFAYTFRLDELVCFFSKQFPARLLHWYHYLRSDLCRDISLFFHHYSTVWWRNPRFYYGVLTTCVRGVFDLVRQILLVLNWLLVPELMGRMYIRHLAGLVVLWAVWKIWKARFVSRLLAFPFSLFPFCFFLSFIGGTTGRKTDYGKDRQEGRQRVQHRAGHRKPVASTGARASFFRIFFSSFVSFFP